jgi:DNA polymerase III sliding clamp (beta) subunit (PCNA family)
MLKELKFVQGAVGKKDLLPAMTHFKIENGEVRGFNGKLAISSPIPFDINCAPKAEMLIRAISQCEETITLSMTPAGKLRIQSGKFRAFVEVVEGDTAHPMPEGQEVFFDGEQFVKACEILYPFIGDDASRYWTNGILLYGQSAFATNNVCLVEYWLGTAFPHIINVPRDCIREVLRVGEAPTHAQMDERSITFHYTNGRWIRSQLLETTWPDTTKILSGPSNPTPVNTELFDGIDALLKMADGSKRIYIKDGLLRTHLEEFTGGVYEMDGLNFEGCYNLAKMALLRGVVTHADFTLYPGPCLFFGERLRGAIIGMRM